MRRIKLVSVGAGSTYTPDFAEKMIALGDSLTIDEWVLMDIDADRLQVVGDFTIDLLDQAGTGMKVRQTTSLTEAVRDADYVITTMRVGRAEGRYLDETIPHKYGLLGQETIAPGGLSMGLRNIPVIVDVARKIEEYAEPSAWLINLANPGGMLTEAVVSNTGCKAVGLCNWPSILWDGIAEAYGYDRARIFLKWYGLNHLNWTDIYIDGRYNAEDAIEKYAIAYTKTFGGSHEESFGDPAILRFLGKPFMVDYNNYYYKLPEILATNSPFEDLWLSMLDKSKDLIPGDLYEKIRHADSRAQMVVFLDQLAIEMYRKGDYNGYKLVAGTRGGAGYGSAGLEVMRAIENNSNSLQVVDFPNLGTYPYLPFRDVVQATCLINGAGVFPLAMGNNLPVHAQSLVQSAKHYEHLAVEAAMTGDYHKALEALVTTPLMNSFEKSKLVLNDLLLAQKENLPNFAPTIARLEQGEDLS